MTSGPIMLPKKLGHKSTLTENVLLIDPTALLTTTLKPIRVRMRAKREDAPIALKYHRIVCPASGSQGWCVCDFGDPSSGPLSDARGSQTLMLIFQGR